MRAVRDLANRTVLLDKSVMVLMSPPSRGPMARTGMVFVNTMS